MCFFCSVEKMPLIDTVEEYEHIELLSYFYPKDKVIKITAYEDEFQTIIEDGLVINYCPFCGKEL